MEGEPLQARKRVFTRNQISHTWSWTSSLRKCERVFCYSSTRNLRQSVYSQMSLFKCLKNIVWVIPIIAKISSLIHIKQNVIFENLYSKFFINYMKKMITRNVVDLSKYFFTGKYPNFNNLSHFYMIISW